MDIAIRAGEGMGGTRSQVQHELQVHGEVYFYRGQRPLDCSKGDRVFLLKHGAFHGFAVFHEYAWREADPGSGAQSADAIVVRSPYKPIDPPLRPPQEFSIGPWRWRYIDSHPETAQCLRRAGY